MANINKIKLSGTTYNIQDLNAAKTVELTQAQYDALTVKDPNTFYVITDAQGADLSNYYTKSETSGATEISTALASKADAATTYNKTEVDTALAGKQATLVSGTNIKTINNESILGSGNIEVQGGGKAIEAGRGISITTGETADTVSFNLPISAGTGEGSIIGGFSGNTASGKYSFALGGRYESIYDRQNCKATGKGAISFGGTASGQGAFSCGENPQALGSCSVAFGDGTKAIGVESFVIGRETSANTFVSFAQGYRTKTTNESEHASGRYNNSVSATTTFGDSGNTLFSVGNGTADNARHNAFEIRQNGDIYCSDGTNDVKLQDTITATAANTAALGGKVDTSAITTSISSSSTDAQVPSAKAVYDQLGGMKIVKLTESEYTALVTKDSNTLYVVVPDPSN